MNSKQLNDYLAISVHDTILAVSGLELESNGTAAQFDHAVDGLSVIVGFLGRQIRGVVAYYFTQPFALEVCRNAFEINAAVINAEVCDACGEVGNMISGGLKKLVVESGLSDYDITVPTIIAGTNYFVNFYGKKDSTSLEFSSKASGQKMYAEIKSETLI